MIGQTISHYEITGKLGEGGMGVVYKAEDTKLERTVALKFLAAHLLKDEEARKRFHREAKAAASLHHANVCPVYEIAEAEGRTFISMAFIEGESLDKRIEQGPLKIAGALDIAQQIAKGLEAAHEKKVVHRDVKPGNVIVDGKGHVTVMDFGLALLTEGSKLTQLDTTVGTVAYMSPEQAQGVEVDHRADIWALGCVLYEMVCGQRPFRGEYDQALLYEIVHEEHEPLTGVRAGVPMELEWIAGKCLAKDRADRYARAEDLLLDLRTLAEKLKSGRSAVLRNTAGQGDTVGTGTLAGPSPRSGDGQAESLSLPRESDAAPVPSGLAVRGWKPLLPWVLFAVTVIALFAVSFTRFRETAPEPALRRFSFTPENFHPLAANSNRGRAAISPNGKHIVYRGMEDEPALWVRDIDREQPRKLAGTEGARDQGLFWSPDSRFIGFATDAHLKKVPVGVGSVVTLCGYRGEYRLGSWSPDGHSIVFSTGIPPSLFEVPDQGGEPELLFDPEITERGRGNWYPSFLPGEAGARAVVFSVGTVNDQEIAVKNLETGQFTVLAVGAFPVYSRTGHIVYQTNAYEGGLWALPFSLETLRATGERFRVAEGLADPSVAEDGTLAAVDFERPRPRQLVWVDRTGRKLGAMGRPQQGMLHPRLSPDGRRAAVNAAEGGAVDIWAHDVDSTVTTRLTFAPGRDQSPTWSPSGKEIAFSSNRRGNMDLHSRAADGSGHATLLMDTPQLEWLPDWSADGNVLLYSFNAVQTGLDIGYLQRKSEGGTFEPHVFLQTAFSEGTPQISPNERFVAYDSDESGRWEVYVRRFPEGTDKRLVSPNGGRLSRWSNDRSELFYVERDTLMAVAVSINENFSAGVPKPLFSHPGLRDSEYRYDVSADGQRFVVIEDVEDMQAKRPSIHIVQNWFEEFRDRRRD